jgi:hypothetical protein
LDIEAMYLFELMNTGIHDVNENDEFKKMFRFIFKIGKTSSDRKKFKDLFGHNQFKKKNHET